MTFSASVSPRKEGGSTSGDGSAGSSYHEVVNSRSITYEQLAENFHLPINEVAKRLGICTTVLKKVCRRNGIPRWPHRKLKALDKMIQNAHASMEKRPEERQRLLKEIRALEEKKQYIVDNPGSLALAPRASGARTAGKVRRRRPVSMMDNDAMGDDPAEKRRAMMVGGNRAVDDGSIDMAHAYSQFPSPNRGHVMTNPKFATTSLATPHSRAGRKPDDSETVQAASMLLEMMTFAKSEGHTPLPMSYSGDITPAETSFGSNTASVSGTTTPGGYSRVRPVLPDLHGPRARSAVTLSTAPFPIPRPEIRAPPYGPAGAVPSYSGFSACGTVPSLASSVTSSQDGSRTVLFSSGGESGFDTRLPPFGMAPPFGQFLTSSRSEQTLHGGAGRRELPPLRQLSAGPPANPRRRQSVPFGGNFPAARSSIHGRGDAAGMNQFQPPSFLDPATTHYRAGHAGFDTNQSLFS